MKNNSLITSENIQCSGMQIRSFWDVDGDEGYQNQWPRDRKLEYADNTVVVVYTEKGNGTITIKGNKSKNTSEDVKSVDKISIRGNSVIFLDPLDIASYGCDGLVWKLYWIELSIDCDTKASIPFNKVVSIENKAHFALQFKEILTQLKHKKSFHRSYAAAIFTKLFYEWLVEAKYTNKTPQQVAVQRVIDEMHLRLMQNWQVKEMSELVGCSEQHLRKLFLQYTGQSPKRYYLTIKLDIAHALLKKGQHSIMELSYELGFSDAFHFSKAFKKQFAFSPSDVIRSKSHYTKNLLSHDES